MKKRNIFAVLATLVAAVTLFAACGSNDETNEEPSTVIGADGQVYKEVTEIATEIVSEVVSEVVTEIRTEPKTDSKGEVVTNSKGVTEVVTEIVSEIVTEIKTEVVTSVVTVTKPYEPTTQAGDSETTTAAQSDTTDTTDSTGETTTSVEDVPFPEGELIEVPLDASGQPQDPLMKRIMTASAETKQLYLDCVIVTGETLGVETGMPCKVYMSGNNIACEFSTGVSLKIRMIVKDGAVSMLFPNVKTYYQIGSSDDANVGDVDMGIWETIGSAEMDYVSTSSVTVNGTKYTCETYNDSTNENRYYFNAKQQLKRIEVETAEGDISIIKVNSCTSTVDSSIFDIPKGYTKLTEEDVQKMMSALQ